MEKQPYRMNEATLRAQESLRNSVDRARRSLNAIDQKLADSGQAKTSADQRDAVARVIKWTELQEDDLLERQAEANGGAIMLTAGDVDSLLKSLRRVRDGLGDVF